MILVMLERDSAEQGGISETSLEALTFARRLAESGGGMPVHAVIVGTVDDAIVARLGQYAVTSVHPLTGEAFESYGGASWARGVEAVQEQIAAVIVLASGTERGNEVMAHVAAHRETPFAANVIGFHGLDPLVVTRQVVGGLAHEEMQVSGTPAVMTVAGHALEAAAASIPVQTDVHELSPAVADADLVARVAEVGVREADHSGNLKSARVVVGAGRGAGSASGFDGVLELAELLGGQLGVSRVVTGLGWRPHHEQIGQTGTRISPELYIACGISGAIQHWAGMSSSKTIVAINTDADAPMVTKAHYAVIGDMHQVVPAINEEIRARRGV